MIMTLLIIAVLSTFINSNINIMAHLFGLAGGFCFPFMRAAKSGGINRPLFHMNTSVRCVRHLPR